MNPFQMNQMMMNPMMMNQMGMNQIGMNNQQNQFNQINMDNTTLEVKNIVQPYEKKIKELEEIIRQKDLEIAILKQKLNKKSSNNNFMNINPMMMSQNMNPMVIPGFFQQPFEDKGEKLEILLKTENGDFKTECFEKDKVSILFEKNNINNGALIYKYKKLNNELTFKENGIKKFYSIIYLKNDIKLICFKDTRGMAFNLQLSDDCPLQLAFIYYLIKSDNVDYLLEIIKGNNAVRFTRNNVWFNFNNSELIGNIFLNGAVITVVYVKELLGSS